MRVEGWTEVRDGQELVNALGVAADEATADLLLLAPESDLYLTTRTELPAVAAGTMGYLIPHTRFFFNVSACRQFWGGAMVALTTYLATNSPQASFVAATLRKAYDNLTLLTEDEAELVHVVIGLCSGNPYRVPVREEAVMRSYTDSAVSV